MSDSRDLMVIREKGAVMRWGLRLAFVVFGTAIGLVVASEPAVLNTAKSGISYLSQRIATDHGGSDKPIDLTVRPMVREVKVAEPIFSAQRFEKLTSTLPTVRVMPESKVNVIRLTP